MVSIYLLTLHLKFKIWFLLTEEQLSPEKNKDVFSFDYGSDLFWHSEGNKLLVLQKGTSITAKQIQRFLLENLLRERVLNTKNIEVMDGKALNHISI